jgi:hypothetical protein
MQVAPVLGVVKANVIDLCAVGKRAQRQAGAGARNVKWMI